MRRSHPNSGPRIFTACGWFDAARGSAALLRGGISITHILPTWPTALAMVAVLTSVLACLYGFLFHFWVGATPGASLARLASRDSDEMHLEEDRPRFR